MTLRPRCCRVCVHGTDTIAMAVTVEPDREGEAEDCLLVGGRLRVVRESFL
jgi:hypothetical protein